MSEAIGDSEPGVGQAPAAGQQNEQDDAQNSDGSESEPKTILDTLNADCWRAVLDWLDVDDVVRSERVSRGWQHVVHEYLQGVHRFYVGRCFWMSDLNQCDKYSKCHKLVLKNDDFVEEMLKKMGPFIVTLLADNFISRRLTVFAQNCPNLEDVTFFKVKRHLPLDELNKNNCRCLKRVTFESCSSLREYYLDRLIILETLEELVINNNMHVSGHFLGRLKSSNIKKLALNKCGSLKIQHLLSAVSFLTEITFLELNDNPLNLYGKVQLLLDQTLKLEHLSLNCNDYPEHFGYSSELSDELITSIGRLSRLKHLSMNRLATDALLVAVARGCKELHSLDIECCCAVSGRVLLSVCRELPLAELSVAGSPDLTDEELAACITSCHSLTVLNVSNCAQVTHALVAAAARDVRRRPRALRLRTSGSAVNNDQNLFPDEKRMGLTLSWGNSSKSQYYEDSDSDSDYDSSDEDVDWDDVVEEYLESRDQYDW